MQHRPEMFSQGEVLLVYFNEQPAMYVRIESVRPDRKKHWWQITLLLLVFPSTQMTWILDDEQMRGAAFTMQQQPIRLERVPFVELDQQNKGDSEAATAYKETPEGKKKEGRVISLFDEE